MFLEGIFGGGSQSSSPSQSSPSSGSSGATEGENTTGDDSTTPASGSQPETVENYSPEETDDGTYGPTPPAEASTDEPADKSASQPVTETENAEPAPAAEDESMSGTEPDTESASGQTGEAGSSNAPAAATAVRDFVSPLLADLQAISQRSSGKASDDVSASQRRAAANVHDQMIRQMLDQISTTGTGGSSTQLFKSKDAEKTQSLPARWYAEA